MTTTQDRVALVLYAAKAELKAEVIAERAGVDLEETYGALVALEAQERVRVVARWKGAGRSSGWESA